MAAVLPTPSDCCDTCLCNVISVDLCPTPSGGGVLVVENTSALRLVLSPIREPNMVVFVLTDVGTPMDGTGYQVIWREESLQPDDPILVVRPADVPTDADPGRFEQFV